MTFDAKTVNRKDTDYIVIHCSATSPDQDIGATDIDRWHRKQGWACIGYHYVIRRNGFVEKGRPLEQVGAHVSGYNQHTVGVCMVGGVDVNEKAEDNFTDEQFKALKELVTLLKSHYPAAIVQGHRDFPNVKKDCPCFDVKYWWDSVNGLTA